MYKFIVIKNSCGGAYDISKAEKTANDMAKQGYVFVQAYQTTTQGCGTPQSSLVMVFRRINSDKG